MKYLLLIPVIVIALLLTLEITLSFFPHKDRNDTAIGFVEPHPELIWKLKTRNSGPFRTNELGFRDTPYNAAADIKILLLGDSVSWADGIDDIQKAYPFLTEKRINDRSNNQPSFEIINAAVPGYSTFQELRYLELHGLALKPRMIILQFCLNDVVERYWTVSAYGGDNIFLGIDTRNGLKGIYGFLYRHSALFETLLQFLQKLSRNWEEYKISNLSKDKLSPELEKAWNTTLNELSSIQKIAQENNIKLFLLIIPYRFQLRNPKALGQPQNRLIEFAHSRAIPYIDLLPMLKKNSFHDQSHLSEKGHELTARILASILSGEFPQNEK